MKAFVFVTFSATSKIVESLPNNFSLESEFVLLGLILLGEGGELVFLVLHEGHNV